jgi:hypothetical protein
MTNPTKQFRNDTSPTEKLETLLNDKRVLRQQKDASTFAQFASSDANQDAGRFAAINKATVVGATPKQPEYAAPNWAPQAVGVEPPLGFDINETPIVGEPYEVEASLERAAQEASAIPTDDEPVRGAGAVPSNTTASSAPANPIPTIKRRRL